MNALVTAKSKRGCIAMATLFVARTEACVSCVDIIQRGSGKNTVEDYDWSHPLVFVCRTGLWVAP